MTDERAERRSIAIALDPAAPIESVLRAGLLLGGPSSRLVGLFVEDAEITEIARSGLAREVTSLGQSRPLVSARLSRQIRLRSRDVRLSFERGARALGVHGSFEVLHGRAIEQLSRRLQGLDALVISRAYRRAGLRSWYGLPVHRLVEAPPCTLLFVQEEWATGSRVLLLAPESERAEALRRLALRLAAAEGLEAVLLGDEAAAPADGFRQRTLYDQRTGSLRAVLLEEDARVLIIPREHELVRGGRFAELLGATDTSLLIA